MKKLFLQVFVLLACAHIYAQNNEVSGFITDFETNQPIAYASVYFPELEKGTTTNENGKFIFKNLPTGKYKLICSVIGYETISKLINTNNTKPITITLQPSAIEMEEVVISTPFHQLQSENVMKVERISINEINKHGAATLANGISNIAGVNQITTGQSIGKPVIRGLSSNRVLVYTQGVRLENQQFGDEHGLGLSDSGISSVEVIKGPASLLYGSDALGGVLYLNPERFAKSNETLSDFGVKYFTNTEGIKIGAGVKSSSQKFKVLFRGSQEAFADYNTKAYRVTNSRFKTTDFKAGLGYQATAFKTEFRYNLNAATLGIPEEISKQSTSKTTLEPFQKVNNHVFSTASTLFLPNSKINLKLGYTYNNRKEFEEHEHENEKTFKKTNQTENHDEAALHMKLKTFSYDIKYTMPKYGKLETILGIQGLHQKNKNYGEEQLIPNATTNDIGVFATSHIHFNKSDLQIGARFDNRKLHISNISSKSFQSFNAAVGYKFNLFNNFISRLNIATGFRSPNLAELTSNGSHEGTNRFEIGNLNLKNEQNIQLDAALEFKNEHIEFFINGFYNSIANYIYLQPNGNTVNNNPVYLYTQNNAKLYGGEVGFHLHPHPLDWLHLESSLETVTGKQQNAYLPLIPATNLNNTLHVDFNLKSIKNVYAFVTLKSFFNQNNVSTFETKTKGYNLLSSGFGFGFTIQDKEVLMKLSGTNLTNKKYLNHLSRLKTDGIYNMGRNFSFSLQLNL